MNQLSQQEFLNLSAKGNLIPVYREILGDLETPVSAYFKLAHQAKYSLLLESVESQEKIGRYSFIAFDPELVFQSKGRSAEIIRFKGKKILKEKREIKGSPLDLIRELTKPFTFASVPQLPQFCGGLVGYLSYDVVRFFEKLPLKTKDDLNIPDIVLTLAKDLVIFDHLLKRIKIVSCVYLEANLTETRKIKKYKEALSKIEGTIKKLQKPLMIKQKKALKKALPQAKSNITKEEFSQMVQKAKEHITAGDIIQVVLSQRFELKISTNGFNIYRSLRAVNPSPYMFYLKFGDLELVGSSPELLVRSINGLVETRPIAGTRPRGKSDQEDEALKQDLLNDPKERAEHVMLVDLGRNDLGRVCAQGTVELSEFMSVEKYSHVMHIVSNVQGKLRDDKDALDVLEAGFPAGTVSGAPKIRAMEIIENLEKTQRGPYAGCVGYFSFSKDMDTCITIRTIVVHKGKAYVQAGAGIVADSVPEKEYEETINKAMAQIRAIKLAHEAIQ